MSVDPPDASARLKQRLGSDFTFLSDADGVLLDALGSRHRRPGEADLAYPTAVLVDGGGVVRWTFQSRGARERAEPEAIFAAIDALPAPG